MTSIEKSARKEDMRNMATIRESVDLFEDEVIVREYWAIDKQYVPILSPGAEGRIAITNRRVISRSELKVDGGKRVELNAVPLEAVQGTCLTVGNRTLWRLLMPGVIAVIAGIRLLEFGGWPSAVLFIAGVIAIICAFRREIRVGVRAASIVRGGFISKAEPEGYLLLAQSGLSALRTHGPDVEVLMRALDAVIVAAQQRGAAIVNDLKCPNVECGYMTMIDDQPPKHCPECGEAWRAK